MKTIAILCLFLAIGCKPEDDEPDPPPPSGPVSSSSSNFSCSCHADGATCWLSVTASTCASAESTARSGCTTETGVSGWSCRCC